MILTKEQCLSDKWNPQSSAIDLDNPHLRDAIFYGMQLFAKEMSIRFSDWIQMTNWSCSQNFGWYDLSERVPKYCTTEQLFELFLQSINQK